MTRVHWSPPKPSAGWWWLFIGLVVAYVALLIWNSVAPWRSLPGGVVATLSLLVGAMLGVQLLFGLWGVSTQVRVGALRREFPSALVLTTGAAAATKRAIRKLPGSPPNTLPSVLFAVADGHGISFRTGATGEPRLSFAWPRIARIEPVVVNEGRRLSNGFGLVVALEADEIEIPFIVTGRGMGGLYPLRVAEIRSAISELDALRANARVGGDSRP